MADLTIFLTDLGAGGAEKVMVNLANGFAQQGRAVDLVLCNKAGKYFSDLHSSIRVIDFGGRKLRSCLTLLVDYLKREKPRVLLSALEDTNIIAICAAKLAAIETKVIVTVHNHLSSEVRHEQRLRRKVVPYLLRWFYPHADSVVAVSKGVALDLAKWSALPIDKLKVIYNPIVTDDLRIKQSEALDHPWLKEEHIPVILGVGRLETQKDFPTLIRAFALVQQQRSTRLIILGEGHERSDLEALIQQLNLEHCIQLLGFVQNPHAYMAKATVCVMSSAWEGFGNILVEAMAAGTPVVSTNCESGPAEILADGKYGRITPVGDAQAMAKAILQTIEMPIDSQTLKQRSQAFSLEAALTQYEQLFS